MTKSQAVPFSALEDKIPGALAELVCAKEEFSPTALASALGAETMVLIDMISRHDLGIEVFTLDTGRLHEETYDLMDRARKRYPQVRFLFYFPETRDTEELLQRHGPRCMFASKEARLECCEVRKVRPLARALAGRKSWITGLRREQSRHRGAVALREVDEGHGIMKFNPLAFWTQEEVWGYIEAFGVPVNALHEKGYPSIGCAPCTRPISPGEDLRAGRWWWEEEEKKECGLHLPFQGWGI